MKIHKMEAEERKKEEEKQKRKEKRKEKREREEERVGVVFLDVSGEDKYIEMCQ